MDWLVPERPMESEQNVHGTLSLPVLVSLLLHGLVLAIFFTLGLLRPDEPGDAPKVVRINLLPANSLQPTEVLEPVEEPAPIEITEPELLVESEAIVVPQNLESEPVNQSPLSVEPPRKSLVEINLPTEVESGQTLQPGDSSRQVQPAIPDRLVMQQAIKSLANQERSNSRNTDCNPSQQKNELIQCDEGQDVAFSIRDTRLANRFFAAAAPLSDARQVQGFIGSNAGVLKERLDSMTVEGLNGDYLINELEAGVGVYSATGNVPLQRLQDQINANDPAYQLMKKMTNPR